MLAPHIFIAGFIPPSGLIQAESQGLQGCSWSNTQIKKNQNQNPSIFGWRSSATRTSQVKIRDQVTESRTTGKVEGGKGRGGRVCWRRNLSFVINTSCFLEFSRAICFVLSSTGLFLLFVASLFLLFLVFLCSFLLWCWCVACLILTPALDLEPDEVPGQPRLHQD